MVKEYRRVTVSLAQRPIYSVYANDQIYLSSASFLIQKHNKYLNESIQSNRTGYYSGLYFNASSDLICATSNQSVSIFDQNLSFVESFRVALNPWFITEYKGMLVITDISTGYISHYKHNVLVETIYTECPDHITSILFDDYNHMMVLCYQPSKLYIYHTNGTYIGIGYQTCFNSPLYMNFDSKGRLVITCNSNIDIYY